MEGAARARKAGVQALFQGDIFHYSSEPVTSVDTTGAGDAFVAGLLFGLSAENADFTATLALAQRCGALATTAKGAMTALPYHQDL